MYLGILFRIIFTHGIYQSMYKKSFFQKFLNVRTPLQNVPILLRPSLQNKLYMVKTLHSLQQME